MYSIAWDSFPGFGGFGSSFGAKPLTTQQPSAFGNFGQSSGLGTFGQGMILSVWLCSSQSPSLCIEIVYSTS